MTISIQSQRLKKMRFLNEDELQGHLERCPYLLVSDSESKVLSVQREVRLPAAGILDLLLVDEEGCPIAVEVKLSRNGQSRREVVAQAFDYVSDLSRLTVDELDGLVDGSLEQVLTDFQSEANLWKACGVNLRAGIIKVVIAVDNANEDLIRIVRYINEHSDLDVRLISISKYDDGKILVPNIIVSGSNSVIHSNKTKKIFVKNIPFEKVVDIYNQQATDELKTRNRAKNFRQVRFDHWPSSIHYEFLDYKNTNQIAVELHLEGDKVSFLGETLASFDGQSINGKEIKWDEKWSKKRGRITVRFPSEESPEIVSKAMCQLIQKTSKVIDEKLTKA